MHAVLLGGGLIMIVKYVILYYIITSCQLSHDGLDKFNYGVVRGNVIRFRLWHCSCMGRFLPYDYVRHCIMLWRL